MRLTNRWISRVVPLGVAGLCATYLACELPEDTSIDEQATLNLQGSNLQGSNLQGMSMLGFQIDGATLGGVALVNLRIEGGEVVAEQNQVTQRGTALIGAHLQAQVRNLNVSPPATTLVEYRITGVVPEDAKYDPTGTGSTFLYTLEQWVDETSSWVPACPADVDGRRVAIPIAATWDERGSRSASSSLFTLGCTTGVIAKCYRWGYRPWVTGYGDLVTMHWTCTRLARADYCGDGVSHTYDGTLINVWDDLPAPGPIQTHGGLLPPLGMLFEAGWDTGGAVCLSHARWLQIGPLIAASCPDRLMPVGIGPLTCDTLSQVLGINSSAHLFNESYLGL
ncbi:MAG TPA: ADYC domain-containing protein [Kofleriaceae bacterium]|nr:ADYC domain-containing protein [Kofleriaceae bacterium]